MSSTNVMVVEPEPTTGTDIRDMLERLGHSDNLIPSMSPSEVSSLQNLAPDLVLIDVKLNGRANGLQIAEAIQSMTSPSFTLRRRWTSHCFAKRKQPKCFGT